jgi:hypothetical protein
MLPTQCTTSVVSLQRTTTRWSGATLTNSGKTAFIMNTPDEPRPRVSAIIVFVSLLAPMVLTGFYLVYALVGLIIDGQSKIKWSDEALNVGLRMLLLIVILNIVVMLYAWVKKVSGAHPLWVSPVAHITVGVLLTVMIVFIQ